MIFWPLARQIQTLVDTYGATRDAHARAVAQEFGPPPVRQGDRAAGGEAEPNQPNAMSCEPHWSDVLPPRSGLYWLRSKYPLPAVVHLNREEGEWVRLGDATVYEVQPELGEWWTEPLEPPGGWVVGPED